MHDLEAFARRMERGDSVALLEVLCRLAREPGRVWDLSVAHLNHRQLPKTKKSPE